jgi:uncharacterized protein YycO
MTLLRFSRGTGRAAAVSRFGSFSDHAQVGFKLDTGLVLDSTPEFGVLVRDAQDDDTTLYFDFLAPGPHIHKAVAWAHAQVGAPYDWSAIFGWCRGTRDWWVDGKQWFSAEFVAAAFIEARWPLVRDGQAFSRITPRDLLLSTRIKPIKREAAGGE